MSHIFLIFFMMIRPIFSEKRWKLYALLYTVTQFYTLRAHFWEIQKNRKTYFVKDSLNMISNDFGGDKLKFVGEDTF